MQGAGCLDMVTLEQDRRGIHFFLLVCFALNSENAKAYRRYLGAKSDNCTHTLHPFLGPT